MAITSWVSNVPTSVGGSSPSYIGQEGSGVLASAPTYIAQQDSVFLERIGQFAPTTGLLWPRPATVVYIERDLMDDNYLLKLGE